MLSVKDITKAYNLAKEICFDNSSKFVIMSDCHRGDGNWSDNFARNQNLYFTAIKHYYKFGYTYIELGDGDELWENRRLSQIMSTHSNVYWILSKFAKENRLIMICGNHDKVKLNKRYIKDNVKRATTETQKQYMEEFESLNYEEAVILKHRQSDKKILLIHGHQGDLLNDKLWRINRFLVRYLWKPIENFGVNDPTGVAKNYKRREMAEKRIIKWIQQEKCMVIAGHTHRPTFPSNKQVPYFNSGSCVHPRCITAIEIDQGYICLVKWYINVRSDGTLFIERGVIEGPSSLNKFSIS